MHENMWPMDALENMLFAALCSAHGVSSSGAKKGQRIFAVQPSPRHDNYLGLSLFLKRSAPRSTACFKASECTATFAFLKF